MSKTTAERIADKIMTEHKDPAAWLIAARAICEAAGLAPSRAIPLGVTLDRVCYAIADEARKQGVAALARLEAVL